MGYHARSQYSALYSLGNIKDGGMKVKVRAILFDTRSIQRYIYASNKLRTNIGASYIVEHLFSDILAGIIDEKYKDKCHIAYNGGGNALVLFKNENTPADEPKKLVEEFSTRLLVEYPGLHIGAAVGDIDTEHGFQSDLSDLYKKLKDSQSNFAPMTDIPYTGFTLLSDQDGEVANGYDKIESSGSESRFCSQAVIAKNAAAEKANAVLWDKFYNIFEKYGADYSFPMELDKLGQKTGENYIAVIHIDGNNMGKKFEGCEGLSKRQKLSNDIKAKTEGAFGKLLETIIVDIENNRYENKLKIDGTLPIRPLIIGGDDVTFVCPAKVALAYTKRFMEYMLEKDDNLDDVAKSIDSCAGIAILPTSYPFFRGYTLAEQLCDNAKKKMREVGKEQGSCWLDFILLHGEQAPTLKQILAQEHKAVKGCTHFGPYQVANKDGKHAADRRYNIENLIKCGKFFSENGGPAIANNKVKELRRVLQLGDEALDNYMQQLGHQGKDLPDIDSWECYRENLWSGHKTPYIDAIEIMDFLEGVDGDE